MYSIFTFVPVKPDTSGSNLQCIVTTVGKFLRILSIMLFCGRENYECVSIDANSTNFIHYVVMSRVMDCVSIASAGN